MRYPISPGRLVGAGTTKCTGPTKPISGLAWGPRYVEECREVNTRDIPTYLQHMLVNESATFQREVLSARERALETLALGLRRMSGIDRYAFQSQTGFVLDSLAGPAIVRNVDLGLLYDDGQYVKLSRRGQYVADSVITSLFG